MKGKIALVVGGAAGYVLGARAGRERYEQIVSQARGLWQNASGVTPPPAETYPNAESSPGDLGI
jgi:hypothetical protein